MAQRCIVIGASAGGYAVLRDIVSRLPADLGVPVFIVLHIAPYTPSLLPEILSKDGPLPAIHPEDGMIIQPGAIYIAPPDHHILIDEGHMAVKRGPKENGFRPSIDALFRSAAYSYGPGAIGVVLSGALNDGTSGLWSIKRLGGIAIIQDPHDAAYPSMPRSVLEYVDADYQVPSNEIGPLLVRLSQQEHGKKEEVEDATEERMAKEIQVASGAGISQQTILDLGDFTPFTCPDCHGSLVRIAEGKLSRFRCHTGHGFSEDALLEGMMQSTGEMLWQALRGFQEVEMMLKHMGRHMQEAGENEIAHKFLAKAQEIQKRASRLEELTIDHESLSRDNVERRPAD